MTLHRIRYTPAAAESIRHLHPTVKVEILLVGPRRDIYEVFRRFLEQSKGTI